MTTNKVNTEEKSNNNPYINARRTWNDYISSETATKKLWQIVALLSLSGCLLSIGGIIYIGSQSKFTPYVIEIDQLGRSQFSGVIPQYNTQDPKIVQIQIMDFINDVRTVSLDTAYQLNMVNRAYAKVENNTPASIKLSEYYQADNQKNNPFKRVTKENVSLDITTILNITDDTYQVEWEEITRSTQGRILKKEKFKATITIYFVDNSSLSFDTLKNNPLGLYIKDFNIQKLRN